MLCTLSIITSVRFFLKPRILLPAPSILDAKSTVLWLSPARYFTLRPPAFIAISLKLCYIWQKACKDRFIRSGSENSTFNLIILKGNYYYGITSDALSDRLPAGVSRRICRRGCRRRWPDLTPGLHDCRSSGPFRDRDKQIELRNGNHTGNGAVRKKRLHCVEECAALYHYSPHRLLPWRKTCPAVG